MYLLVVIWLLLKERVVGVALPKAGCRFHLHPNHSTWTRGEESVQSLTTRHHLEARSIYDTVRADDANGKAATMPVGSEPLKIEHDSVIEPPPNVSSRQQIELNTVPHCRIAVFADSSFIQRHSIETNSFVTDLITEASTHFRSQFGFDLLLEQTFLNEAWGHVPVDSQDTLLYVNSRISAFLAEKRFCGIVLYTGLAVDGVGIAATNA